MCSRGTFLTDDENEKRCSAPQPAGECVGMSRYAEKLYGAKAPLGNVGKEEKMCSLYTKMNRGEVSGETLAKKISCDLRHHLMPAEEMNQHKRRHDSRRLLAWL